MLFAVFLSSQLFSDEVEVPADLGVSVEALRELPDEKRYDVLSTRLIAVAARERSLPARELDLKHVSFAKSKKEHVLLTSGAHVGVWLQGSTSKTLHIILTQAKAAAESDDDESSSRSDADDADDDDDDDDDEDGSEDDFCRKPKRTSNGDRRGTRAGSGTWTFDDDTHTSAAADRDEPPIRSPAVEYGEEHDKMEDRMRERKVPSASSKDGTQSLWDRFSQLKPVARREVVDAALRVEFKEHEMPPLYQDPLTGERLTDPPVYDWAKDDTLPPLTSKGRLKWYKVEPGVHGLKSAFPGWDFVTNRLKATRGRAVENSDVDGEPPRKRPSQEPAAQAPPTGAATAGAFAPGVATLPASGEGFHYPLPSQMQVQMQWMHQMRMVQQMMGAANAQPAAAGTTSMPAGWARYWDDQHQCPYYHCETTGALQWQPPAPQAPPPPALPAGWHKLLDPLSGAPYYYNYATNASQWTLPQ